MTTAKKFSHTDAGMFRSAMHDAGLARMAVCQIYNDLRTDGSNKRRLKAYCSSFEWSRATPTQKRKVEANLKAVFGARFIRIGENAGVPTWYGATNDGDLCVYLDDNLGEPFKRPIDPNAKPRKAAYNAPAYLNVKERDHLWRTALGLAEDKRVPYNQIRILKEDVVGFKKVYSPEGGVQMIANLVIPRGSKVRISHTKCRANKAMVHSIFRKTSHTPAKKAYSSWDSTFEYKSGKMAIPRYFTEDASDDCGGGIHFFVDVNRALNY